MHTHVLNSIDRYPIENVRFVTYHQVQDKKEAKTVSFKLILEN